MRKSIFNYLKFLFSLVFIFGIFSKDFTNIPFDGDVIPLDTVFAEVILPNDLSIVKNYSGVVYPGAEIEAIIDYTNNGSWGLSGINITDIYSEWLTFDSIISSYPDITTYPISFSHDTNFRALNWGNIYMSWDSSGQIILKYIVSDTLPENIDVTNEWTIWIWCVLCQDPYTGWDDWFSIWFVNPTPREAPPPYDIGLSWGIPLWDTYLSWEYFYVHLYLTNDTYTWEDVMLSINYKTYLLNFVDIVSSGGLSFPIPHIIHSNNDIRNIPNSFNSYDDTNILRDGFSLPLWATEIILRFEMNNDYSISTPINFNIGISDEYGIMSTIWETDATNNNISSTVQSTMFDLWTTISILTWDEISPSIYSSTWTVTFRIEFWNIGHARDNIFLYFTYNNSNDAIWYTGDRDYGPVNTGNYENMRAPEVWWWYVSWRDISLWTGETWYIDVTFNVHQCWVYSPRSYISILDNYNTILWLNDIWSNYYFLNRWFELDIENNTSDYLYVESDGVCDPWTPRYYDNVIWDLETYISGDFVPWKVVTFWVPINTYTSNDGWYQLSMWFEYDTWLTFLWLVSTGVWNNIWIIDNISQDILNIRNNLIQLNYNNDFYYEAEYIYNNPASFATWECGFTTFPTWTPLDDPFPIRSYIVSVSWMTANIYTEQYQYYKSIWYNELYSHIYAFVDTQVAIYSHSYSSAADNMMDNFADRYYPCVYNSIYTDMINNWMSTGQADSYAQTMSQQELTQFLNKSNLFSICDHNWLNIFSNTQLCSKNESIIDIFYNDSLYLDQFFSNKIKSTLDAAYSIWLSTSWFRQLLINNIIPVYNLLEENARQYSIINSWGNWIIFCDDILCVENYHTRDGIWGDWISIWYDDYIEIINNYDEWFYSWEWISRNWWYVETNSILYFWTDSYLFVDDFSQSGKIQISHFTLATNEALMIWLNFVINEVPPWSILNVLSDIWIARWCSTYPYARDYNQWCLTDISWGYNDSYDPLWWTSWDIMAWDDNSTWTSITIWYREPYDLNITKIMNTYEDIYAGDIVEIITTVCNSGSSRNDINITEYYPVGVASFYNIWTWTNIWVSHTIDTIWSRLIWSNVSIDSWECKQIISQYRISDMVISWTIINFSTYGWSSNIWLSSNHIASAQVSWSVIAPEPNIYSPYGNKEILYSTFYAGDEIFYRINYSNPGAITWIMNLYDIYESWLIFSWIINSTQSLPILEHDLSSNTITWSNIIVEPFSSHSIDLSFVISEDKLPFDMIRNNFSYNMLFVPENYITDINQSNNQSSWRWSYSLNIFEGIVLEDTNTNNTPDIWDLPISSATVSISQSGILIWSTITSSTWYYLFTWLLPGLYTISYTSPLGYTTIWSFIWNISNWSLSLDWVSIDANYPSYSSSSSGNITLMSISTGTVCWNNIIEMWESCDDGSNNGLAWYCNTTCAWTISASMCWDWVINTGEQCDDNNNNNGDGCSTICQFELPSCSIIVSSYISNNPLIVSLNITWYWFDSMQILRSINYGDASIDDVPIWLNFTHWYNHVGPYDIVVTVANIINNNITATCNITVQWITNTFWWGGWWSYYCGDGIVDNNEQCDDGNSNNSDDCTNMCVINNTEYDCTDTGSCWWTGEIETNTISEFIEDIFTEENDSIINIIKIIPRTWAY